MKSEQEWENIEVIVSRATNKIMEKVSRELLLIDATTSEVIRNAIEAYKKAPEGGWPDEKHTMGEGAEKSMQLRNRKRENPNASPTYARRTTVPVFPIMVEDRTKTIGYWHVKDANDVLLADVYSDEMARNIHYCFNHSDLLKTIENLKEIIRLMVYPPLTERLRLAETHAGPFSLIEAKLGKDKLPEQKGQDGPMISGSGQPSSTTYKKTPSTPISD